jgi:tripartite-type tricarboxylate transporter receptor subunit TctC
MLNMKTFLLPMVTAVALVAGAPASAQPAADYPNKPIKMVLPFGAGGGGDVLGRLLADQMSRRLKQPIVVENRVGAAGTIGTQHVAVSAPDGYTIMIGGMTTHLLAPVTYSKLAYDPVKDFSVIGRIGTSAIVMLATLDFPANNLKELVALAKSKPNPTQYGSWGMGSTGHFCGEVLAQKAGLQLQHVPFNGTNKLVTDMMGGHIQLGLVDMATGTPFVKEGKLKALGVCTQRSPSLPDVASYKEQGIDFDQLLSWVMYAPANVPKPILARLTEALQASLKDKEVVDKMLALGITADFLPGDQQAAINARDIQIWKKVAADANIKTD